MAEGGQLAFDQKRYLYDRLFGSDSEDDSPRVVEPAVVVDLKQQTEPRERCILRLRVRKIPGTNMYQNLSYKNPDEEPKVEAAKIKLHDEERQDDVVKEPKVEAAKRKLQCEERQERGVNKISAKKSHGNSVRARIEWKSKHLGVRKSKHLGVHKPNLLMAF